MATAALPMPMGGSAAALRAAESRATSRVGNGGWTYTGTGRDDNADDKIKAKGKVKNKIVAIIIVALLGGGGAFLGSSNSLLAPAIENLFTEATDTQYTSANLRSRKLLHTILSGDDLDIKTKGLWSGKYQVYGSISSSFKRRLKKQGIEITGTGRNQVLVFETTDVTGKKITTEIPASEFRNRLETDIEFRKAYTSAKRGRVATFFDNVADKIYNRLNISRNLFNNYRQTGDTDTDTKNYEGIMSRKFDGDVDITKRTAIEETRTEEIDGEEVTTTNRYTAESSIDGAKADTKVQAETKARNMLDSMGANIAKAAGTGICAIAQIASTISVMIAAMEITQSINYFMGDVENISKMMGGYGDSSAINALLNKFSTPATATVTDFSTTTYSLEYNTDLGDVPNITASEKEIANKSPLESNGMQFVLGGAKNNTSNASLFSLERVIEAVSLGSGLGRIYTCAAVNTVVSILSIVADFATLGAKSIVSGILNIVVGATISIAASALLSFLIPTLAEKFFTNIFEGATGIEIGELFTRGASASNTRVGRSGSGQSLSSKEVAVAYNQSTQEVIAFDAEVDRLTHSPFDITNKNTFFGSIAYSLLPAITTSKTTSLASFVRTATQSIGSLVSPVKASGEGSSYMTTFGDCPTLESIGAVGDMYCNPITTTDPNLINIDLEDPTYQAVISNELDSDGNIKSGDLANYVNFCANRESPFGVADQGVLSALQLSDEAGTVGGAILNSLPILGDLIGIIESAQDVANTDWATGKRCVNSPDNTYEPYPGVQRNFWEDKGRYYQRYIEDSRLLEEMGMIDENPVTAYEEKYLKENPLDNSQSGILARMTGQTKENIEIALTFLDYYQYINNYDPSARIAMNEPTLSEKSGEQVATEIKSERLYFEDKSIIDSREEVVIAKQYIVYSDLRNRSYTV